MSVRHHCFSFGPFPVRIAIVKRRQTCSQSREVGEFQVLKRYGKRAHSRAQHAVTVVDSSCRRSVSRTLGSRDCGAVHACAVSNALISFGVTASLRVTHLTRSRRLQKREAFSTVFLVRGRRSRCPLPTRLGRTTGACSSPLRAPRASSRVVPLPPPHPHIRVATRALASQVFENRRDQHLCP